MLTPRDQLIIQIAERMGFWDDEVVASVVRAKQSSPEKPVDKILRDLGLISKPQRRALAKEFNLVVRRSRELGVPPTSEAAHAGLTAAPARPAAAPAVENEATYVLKDNTNAAVEAEATYVLQENRAAPAPAPVTEAEATYVLQENRAAPAPVTETEGTYVLRDEDAAPGAAAPVTESEATYVLQENRGAPTPATETEATYVLRDEDAAASDAPVTEDEPTYVLKDEPAARPPERQAWSARQGKVKGAEQRKRSLKAKLREKRRRKTESQDGAPRRRTPTPAGGVATGNSALDEVIFGGPQSAAPAAPNIENEPTYVLRDEPTSARAAPVTESEATYVLREDDLSAKAPAPVTESDATYVLREDPAAPAPVTETEGTYVLREEDEIPDLPVMEADSTYVLPENRGAPIPAATPVLDTDPTYVLKDEPAAEDPYDYDPLDDELALDVPDDLENDPTYVLPELDGDDKDPLSAGADLDLGIVAEAEPPPLETDPTYVLEENREPELEAEFDDAPDGDASEAVELDEPELELIEVPETPKEKKAVPESAASSHEMATYSGGALLDRDVFKRLARDRKSFNGFRIGDYRVSGEISRGAMGVVLKAKPRGIARTMAKQRGFEGHVALKVMLENAQDPQEAERFAEEMKVLTTLKHPHIVRMFDSGRERGLSYISMELIKGENVRDLVRRDGVPPFLLTVRIVAEIASALAFVHRRKVYHRDLKPTNIIFDRQVTPFRAVLIDFGLVTNKQTSDKGLILGTPQYMPPEQAKPSGNFGRVNATSDVYSLGATFYYMLTGKAPFEGRDPRKIIKRVISEEVKSPISHNPEVPKRIAEICMRCLEKRQPDRYPSASQLHEDLLKELKGQQRMLKGKSLFRRLWNPKG